MMLKLKLIAAIAAINFAAVSPKNKANSCDVKNQCRIVYAVSKILEIKHADIVTAKARLETGCGCAGVGKSKNNLFGFRKTKEYIKFNSIIDCLIYYKNWQDKRYNESNHPSYFEFLRYSGWVDGKKNSERMDLYIEKLQAVWKRGKYF